jgi:hypothetical protein
MAADAQNLKLDDPAQYRIRAQGAFDPRWLEMLSGVWVITRRRAARPRVTTLVGSVADQAALLGVLEQLYSLGLPILSVECLTPTGRPNRPRERLDSNGHKLQEETSP